MAIRRCPYCKAIIDEQDKYCNNCGTQLLFPEDEFVEEEIPGDRIVEEEEEAEEEEETESEALEERAEPEETKSRDDETDEEEEEEEEEEKREIHKLEERDEDSEELEEPEVEIEGFEEEEEEEFGPEAEEEELEEIGAGEPVGKAAQVSEPDTKYRVSIEEDELVFKTKDLESAAGTADEGQEKLEQLLSSIQKERARTVTPHEPSPLFQEGEEPATRTKDELPPWASGMKEALPPSADLEKSAEIVKETETTSGTTPTRPDWITDSGIGIPEKVTQAALPFGTPAVPATAAGREAEDEEAIEEPVAERRQRARFSLNLKSKLVDLVFITALWIVSLWFTAQVIGVSLFRLIGGSPIPVLAFYFILLLLYFFLFLYFLGETLGDHYFSEED